MIKSRPDRLARSYVLNLSLMLLGLSAYIDTWAVTAECRPLHLVDASFDGPAKFGRGLLWEVSRDGVAPSYLFGTMHVDDEEIVNLPTIVLSTLESSRYFVMETVPTQEDSMQFSTEMFFTDGNRLDEILHEDIFDKTASILQGYNMTTDIVALMKPWAAYVIMSYPANMGEVLDLKLLNLARQNGAVVSGLESFREQIDIFSDMPLHDQARVLADIVCHYDRVSADLSMMKSFYLDQDLEGLYRHSQRYSFADNSIYEQISARLVTGRNNLMVERMGSTLDKGNAFIAVGAMHLPGVDGILNQLEIKKYRLTRIY